MNFEIPDMDCYGAVWFATLMQAVEDATVFVPDAKPLTEQHYYQRTAILWFKNPRHDVGSFVWICSVLNLDPDEVLQRVRDKRALNRRST
jgi:hypothetical protein